MANPSRTNKRLCFFCRVWPKSYTSLQDLPMFGFRESREKRCWTDGVEYLGMHKALGWIPGTTQSQA